MRPRVLFYVQHLLGIGHIKRASLLVHAWLDAGLDVTVVSGGEPVPQFGFGAARLIQLPALKARDSAFSGLVDAQGAEIDAAFKQQRTQQLIAALEEVQPQLLVIENYPFGRRQLRWELLPLLERAQQLSTPPRILCSVRDILQRRSFERVDETVALIDRYFDAVLVHGDSHFIALQSSFPRAQAFADKLQYTGYVTEALISRAGSRDGSEPPSDAVTTQEEVAEVLVSAGGGAVGFALMRTCLELLSHPELAIQLNPVEPGKRPRWRFLVGPNLSEQQQRQLRALVVQVDPAGTEVIMEPLRADFGALLRRCRLSISQGGYNTLMDLLAARCPALVVPFEGGGETEQLARSERLAELGYCQMLREADLNPLAVLEAINACLSADRPQTLDLECQGAAHSAQILKRLVNADD
ncbi:MAG: putative glycosyltransferase [Motiliproteus sp.]|jgi:predicted glycosyltransferase